ncbi:MAG TPA: DUF2892 domain-containing protein [Herbaspirillum sp.]|uniref:YgaP family membrane protein n=1 Tax=Herbaspirillum sp. TaxID=1890675 RepID=UPI002D3FEBB5|nr:DUF2892 domain-containing protein [Herbaspirillum sp.]HZG19300.1 DUF2892 domain-containing protein [Herbaspirillum sp.]
MFFKKNLAKWERALRLCAGLAVVGAAFLIPFLHEIQWPTIGVGALVACTGCIGFCPMCALFGRKLKDHGH